MLALLSSCWLGFLIGLRHALDADHLAAVSTLVVEQPRKWRAASLGAFWGVGHSAALLGAGALLLAFRAQLSERSSEWFELGVSLMLVGLGIRSVRRSLQQRGKPAAHRHGERVHVHAGESDHFHIQSWTIARRPFLVGIAHGLAGTGAITALALASMPSAGAAFLYLALFAAGSIAGMALLTGIAGFPIEKLARRPAAHSAVTACVGGASLVVGIVWGVPIAGHLLGS